MFEMIISSFTNIEFEILFLNILIYKTVQLIKIIIPAVVYKKINILIIFILKDPTV